MEENNADLAGIDSTLHTLTTQVHQLLDSANEEAAKLREENGALEDRIANSEQRIQELEAERDNLRLELQGFRGDAIEAKRSDRYCKVGFQLISEDHKDHRDIWDKHEVELPEWRDLLVKKRTGIQPQCFREQWDPAPIDWSRSTVDEASLNGISKPTEEEEDQHVRQSPPESMNVDGDAQPVNKKSLPGSIESGENAHPNKMPQIVFPPARSSEPEVERSRDQAHGVRHTIERSQAHHTSAAEEIAELQRQAETQRSKAEAISDPALKAKALGRLWMLEEDLRMKRGAAISANTRRDTHPQARGDYFHPNDPRRDSLEDSIFGKDAYSRKRSLPQHLDHVSSDEYRRKSVCIHCWQHRELCDFHGQCDPCRKAGVRCVRKLCSLGLSCRNRRCPCLHPEQWDEKDPDWIVEGGDLPKRNTGLGKITDRRDSYRPGYDRR